MALWLLTQSPAAAPDQLIFNKVLVDENRPRDIRLKSIGELYGDRKPDLLAGGHSTNDLVWHENPGWKEHVIKAPVRYSTGGEVACIDDVREKWKKRHGGIAQHADRGGERGWPPRSLRRQLARQRG